MNICSELTHTSQIQSTVINADGNSVSNDNLGKWLFVPEDVEAALDQVHSSYGRTGGDWIFAMGTGIISPALMPWALVCFNRDYKVIGHILRAKQGNRLMGISSYTKLTLEPGEIPESIGCLHVFQKGVLEQFKNDSPIFSLAWETLADLPTNKNWLVILDPFDGKWIEVIEDEDKNILNKILSEGRAPTPVRG